MRRRRRVRRGRWHARRSTGACPTRRRFATPTRAGALSRRWRTRYTAGLASGWPKLVRRPDRRQVMAACGREHTGVLRADFHERRRVAVAETLHRVGAAHRELVARGEVVPVLLELN